MKSFSIVQRFFKFDKSVYGWAIYDWANSAFATTVMAGFFPLFFKQYWSFGADVNVSTAQLGFGNALGGLIVAALAPILGAIADRSNAKKKFLIFFAYLGSLMTAALFLVQKGDWQLAIIAYLIGVVGFSGANVFYDALLTTVAPKKEVDYISGFGYALGYLGGGLLFLVNVLMTLYPHAFGLADAANAVKVSFLTVALWWGGFTVFTILWVKEEFPTPVKKQKIAVGEGWRQLVETFQKIRFLKNTGLFLCAYWLYIDGVHTIIRMAVDYGLSLGLKDTYLITALLMVQFIGFPASILYGKLGQTWNTRNALFFAILLYMAITAGGIFISNSTHFFLLAIGIGLVQGGIQALSRSYFIRLIPHSQAGEFFGFYNMIGKFAVIFGPLIVGLVGLLVKQFLIQNGMSDLELQSISNLASRWGIGSLLLLFIAGGIFLSFVDEEEGKNEIEKYEANGAFDN